MDLGVQAVLEGHKLMPSSFLSLVFLWVDSPFSVGFLHTASIALGLYHIHRCWCQDEEKITPFLLSQSGSQGGLWPSTVPVASLEKYQGERRQHSLIGQPGSHVLSHCERCDWQPFHMGKGTSQSMKMMSKDAHSLIQALLFLPLGLGTCLSFHQEFSFLPTDDKDFQTIPKFKAMINTTSSDFCPFQLDGLSSGRCLGASTSPESAVVEQSLELPSGLICGPLRKWLYFKWELLKCWYVGDDSLLGADLCVASCLS